MHAVAASTTQRDNGRTPDQAPQTITASDTEIPSKAHACVQPASCFQPPQFVHTHRHRKRRRGNQRLASLPDKPDCSPMRQHGNSVNTENRSCRLLQIRNANQQQSRVPRGAVLCTRPFSRRSRPPPVLNSSQPCQIASNILSGSGSMRPSRNAHAPAMAPQRAGQASPHPPPHP